MAMIWRWLTLCLLLAVPLSAAVADPLPQPPPVGTWAAFPNSALRPAMLAAPGAPVTCCDAKYIFDYSGGWWDEERQELGVWGGGPGGAGALALGPPQSLLSSPAHGRARRRHAGLAAYLFKPRPH